jgi:hypothetical protein
MQKNMHNHIIESGEGSKSRFVAQVTPDEGTNRVVDFIDKHPGCRVLTIAEDFRIPGKSNKRHIMTSENSGDIGFIGSLLGYSQLMEILLTSEKDVGFVDVLIVI